jgi:hypothetical protein
MIKKERLRDAGATAQEISQLNVKLFQYIFKKIKSGEESINLRVLGLNNESIIELLKNTNEQDEKKALEFISKISIPLFLPNFRFELNPTRFGFSNPNNKEAYFSIFSNRNTTNNEELKELNFMYINLIKSIAQDSKIISSMLFKITEDESKYISEINIFDIVNIKNHNNPIFEIATLIHRDDDTKIIKAILEQDIFHTNLLLRKYAMRAKECKEVRDCDEGIIYKSTLEGLSPSETQYNYSISYILGKWLSEEETHPFNISAILPRISRSSKKKLTNKKGNKPKGSSWIMNSNNDRIIANMILGLSSVLYKTKPNNPMDEHFRRKGEEHVYRLMQICEGYHFYMNGLVQDEKDEKRYLANSSNGKKINSERIHFLLNGLEDDEIHMIKCKNDGCGCQAYIHYKNPRAKECVFCHKQHEYDTIEDC